jgi:hypothetical protein
MRSERHFRAKLPNAPELRFPTKLPSITPERHSATLPERYSCNPPEHHSRTRLLQPSGAILRQLPERQSRMTLPSDTPATPKAIIPTHARNGGRPIKVASREPRDGPGFLSGFVSGSEQHPRQVSWRPVSYQKLRRIVGLSSIHGAAHSAVHGAALSRFSPRPAAEHVILRRKPGLGRLISKCFAE